MRRIRVAVALCVLAIVFWTCPGSSPLATAQPGGKEGGALRLAFPTNIASLDPVRINEVFTFLVGYQIYEGLVDIDENYQVIPGLAESWEQKGDTTWVFRLRPGVTFADDPAFQNGKGREVTAEDVKYSFERVVSPKTKSAGPWIFRNLVQGAEEFFQGKANEVSGFSVKEKYTFQIELVRPYPPLLNRLITSFGWILPREAVEKYGEDLSTHPVGTGPFRLAQYVPDNRIVLEKNPGYWAKDQDGRGLPYLSTLEIRIIQDEKTQFLEFQSGSLDLGTVPTTDYPRVVGPDGKLNAPYQKYQFVSVTAFEDHFIGVMMGKAPLGDANAPGRALRQAFNYAIDKEAIAKHILKGEGTPAQGIIPPGFPTFDPGLTGYPYDPAKARLKLAEAGFPDGKGLPEVELLIEPGTASEAVGAAIQAQVRKVGIPVKLRTTPFSPLVNEVFGGSPLLAKIWIVGPYPDPESFYLLFLSSNLPPHGWNMFRYSNPTIDQLFEQAMQAPRVEERRALYHQIERVLVEDAPWIFLYHKKASYLLQPYVQGVHITGFTQRIRFKQAWLDK
jgi:oligopeptide transport system substrate-binding protein